MTPQFQKAFSFWMLQDSNSGMLLNHPTDISLGDTVSDPLNCVGTNPSNIVHPNHPHAFYPLAPHLKPIKVRIASDNKLEQFNGRSFFHTSDLYFGHIGYWPVIFGVTSMADNHGLGVEFIEEDACVKINVYDPKTTLPMMWVSLPKIKIVSDEFEHPYESYQIPSDRSNAELFFNICDFWKHNVIQVSKKGKLAVFQTLDTHLLFTAGSYYDEVLPWYFVDKATGTISGKVNSPDLIHFRYHPHFTSKSYDFSTKHIAHKFHIIAPTV